MKWRDLMLLAFLTLMGCGMAKAGGSSGIVPEPLDGFRVMLEIGNGASVVRSGSQVALPASGRLIKASVPAELPDDVRMKIYPSTPAARYWAKGIEKAHYLMGKTQLEAKVFPGGGISLAIPTEGWGGTMSHQLTVVASRGKDIRLIANILLAGFIAADLDVGRHSACVMDVPNVLQAILPVSPLTDYAGSSADELVPPTWARYRITGMEQDASGNVREVVIFSMLPPQMMANQLELYRLEFHTILRSVGGDVQHNSRPHDLHLTAGQFATPLKVEELRLQALP